MGLKAWLGTQLGRLAGKLGHEGDDVARAAAHGADNAAEAGAAKAARQEPTIPKEGTIDAPELVGTLKRTHDARLPNRQVDATAVPPYTAPTPALASRPAIEKNWFSQVLGSGKLVAGTAVSAGVAAVAGSLWATNNQRDEALKDRPWAQQSFTTTMLTTGGFIGKYVDTDSNLDNGHSYIEGIYNQWKAKQQESELSSGGKKPSEWSKIVKDEKAIAALPPLWNKEFVKDAATLAQSTEANNRQVQAKATEGQAIRDRETQNVLKDAVDATKSIYAPLPAPSLEKR